MLAEPELGGLGIALMPFAASAVAFRVAETAWAPMAGAATVMLGALSSLGAVLYFLASY